MDREPRIRFDRFEPWGRAKSPRLLPFCVHDDRSLSHEAAQNPRGSSLFVYIEAAQKGPCNTLYRSTMRRFANGGEKQEDFEEKNIYYDPIVMLHSLEWDGKGSVLSNRRLSRPSLR